METGFNLEAAEELLINTEICGSMEEVRAFSRICQSLTAAIATVRASDALQGNLIDWLRESGLLLKKHEGMPWEEVVKDLLSASGVRTGG